MSNLLLIELYEGTVQVPRVVEALRIRGYRPLGRVARSLAKLPTFRHGCYEN